MALLEDQVAIVTGAGKGVGRGTALAVAAEGARVVVLGRTLASCEAVAAEIYGRGGEAIAEQCDVEHADEIEASVKRVVAHWGRIDLLVNNAHTKIFRPIRSLTDADMETMWQSGPMATLRFMQACFQHLRESSGCVAFHEENAEELVGLIGADRVLFGSDWPHPEGIAEPRSFFELLDGLSEDQQRAIMADNLRGLLSLAVTG